MHTEAATERCFLKVEEKKKTFKIPVKESNFSEIVGQKFATLLKIEHF